MRIESDGTTIGTNIFANGKQLTNVTGFQITATSFDQLVSVEVSFINVPFTMVNLDDSSVIEHKISELKRELVQHERTLRDRKPT